MYGIDFHADDYAASVETSRRILSLLQAGRVDSISVIPNMGCYGPCMSMLREGWDAFPRKPLLSAHLNLIDGFWLSEDEKGKVIQNSWGGILLHSLLPGRRRLRQAYAAEMEAQLNAFLTETRDLRDDAGAPISLRIDSHVHTHMIPLVFSALTDALRHMGLEGQVRFIRCSGEPLSRILFVPGVAGTLSPVNLLKNLILHLLSHSARRKLRRMGIDTGHIFGIAMTGEMDRRRVEAVLPGMKAFAQGKNTYLEVLSHPGRALPEEISREVGPDDQRAFLSPKRDVEYNMLMELSDASRASV